MKKGERTREFIIEKAAAILNKKGMAGTAINDIMEATNLTKGGIYRNFESKDEICAAAFHYLSGKLSSRINEAMNAKEGAESKLFALLDFYVESSTLLNGGGCPILNFGTEADDTNPMIKSKVAEAIKSFQNKIYRTISAGIEKNEFKSDIDAEEFSVKMFSMLEGAILTCKVLHDNYQMKMITDLLKREIITFRK
jgi:TetR/AcrR family transcriptional repressor of nem operon